MDANERVPALVQRALETDDDELECIRRVRADVIGHLGDVRVVQRRVDLVENEERTGLVAANTNARSAPTTAGRTSTE